MQILVALLLGLAYVAPPGPVNIETIRRGAASGFRGAFGLQLGALVGDVCYAVLTLLGIGALLPLAALRLGLAPLGTAVLAYFGYSALRDGIGGFRAARTYRRIADRDGTAALRRGFLAGFGISLTNPLAIVFWLTVGYTVLPRTWAGAATFLVSFFLGMLAWMLALPLLSGTCRAALQGHAFSCVSLVCGIVLLGFAAGVGSAAILAPGALAHVLP